MEENNKPQETPEENVQNSQASQEQKADPGPVGYDEEHQIDLTGSLENMEPNMAAALSYLVPPFTGIVFFVIEKKNKFVRFHAFQSTLFGFVAWGAMAIVRSFPIRAMADLLNSMISVVTLLLWLFLMWKAYEKEEFEIPILGKVAKDQVLKDK